MILIGFRHFKSNSKHYDKYNFVLKLIQLSTENQHFPKFGYHGKSRLSFFRVKYLSFLSSRFGTDLKSLMFLVPRHRAVNYIAICFAAQTDERHLQTKILSENSRVKCYWWLVELPYWFKATFLLKILGNLSNVR